jgi:hypothetical protein
MATKQQQALVKWQVILKRLVKKSYSVIAHNCNTVFQLQVVALTFSFD